MLLITCDVDWAPDEVIEDTIALLLKYQVKCTFFATHKTKVLSTAQRSLFEVGIHPNFNHLLEGESGTAQQIVSDLLAIYPSAKGVRAHSLITGSKLVQLYQSLNLNYEASLFIPYNQQLNTFTHFNGLQAIPSCWEDDFHFLKNLKFDELGVDLNSTGLTVMNFHPIHIYLNTEDESHYLAAKNYYHQPDKLSEFRRKTSVVGVRTAFEKVLGHLSQGESKTMSEIIV